MEAQVSYHCQDCGKQFQTSQGSRRRYCDRCYTKRMLRASKKRWGHSTEGTGDAPTKREEEA